MMMSYRMMAEEATDLACKKLGVDKKCETATTPLPGSEPRNDEQYKTYSYAQKAAEGRHGTLTSEIKSGDNEDDALVCECEEVTVGEVKYAINQLHVHNLINLRRRTRVGMGTCQGELCACRAACVLGKESGDTAKSGADLASFINERWKGMQPVAWGDTLSEAQLTATIYQGLCGLNKFVDKKEVEK